MYMSGSMNTVLPNQELSQSDGFPANPPLDAKTQSTDVTIGDLQVATDAQNASHLAESNSREENAIIPEITLPVAAGAATKQISSHDSPEDEDDALSIYAARRKRRAWVRDQLASAKAAGELHPALNTRNMDEGFCWICARRGLFKFCPQVTTRDTNPKIIIEDHLGAAFYAAEAANSEWKPEEQRIVFYTDMAAISGTERDPSVAGIGVTYKRIMENDVPEWFDAKYGILGTNRPDKAELYAIGLALEIAASEIQVIYEGLCESEKQGESVPPTIMIITDSQASLYFIHDFVWEGGMPTMFSQETFTKLMRPIARLQELKVPVEFHWVPSHTSIEGNCRADALAGQASRWALTTFRSRMYQTLFECQVIEARDLPVPETTQIPETIPKAQTPGRGKKPSKAKIYTDLAKQIQGMQAEWMSDQMAALYRPGDT